MNNFKSLLVDLFSGDDTRAEHAAIALAQFGKQALQALRPLAYSQQADTRWWAVRALAELDTEDTSSLLIQALHDPDPSIQQCAALAFRQGPQIDAVPHLITLLAPTQTTY